MRYLAFLRKHLDLLSYQALLFLIKVKEVEIRRDILEEGLEDEELVGQIMEYVMPFLQVNNSTFQVRMSSDGLKHCFIKLKEVMEALPDEHAVLRDSFLKEIKILEILMESELITRVASPDDSEWITCGT